MMAGVAMQHHACRAYSLLHARPQRINKTRQDKESKKGRLVNRSGPPWGGHVRLSIVTRKGNQASKQAKSGVMGGWSLEVEMAVAESSTFESSALKKVPPIHFLPSLFSVPIYPPARLTHLVCVRVRGINPALVHVFGRRARMRDRHRLRRR